MAAFYEQFPCPGDYEPAIATDFVAFLREELIELESELKYYERCPGDPFNPDPYWDGVLAEYNTIKTYLEVL